MVYNYTNQLACIDNERIGLIPTTHYPVYSQSFSVKGFIYGRFYRHGTSASPLATAQEPILPPAQPSTLIFEIIVWF